MQRDLLDEANLPFLQKYAGKQFPVDHMKKVEKEMTEFCRVLELEGVTVRRPDKVDYAVEYTTPDFKSTGK